MCWSGLEWVKAILGLWKCSYLPWIGRAASGLRSCKAMQITAAELFDDSDEEVKPTMGKRKARGEDAQHKKSAEKTQAEKKPKTNSAPVEEQPERPVTLSVSRRGYTDGASSIDFEERRGPH